MSTKFHTKTPLNALSRSGRRRFVLAAAVATAAVAPVALPGSAAADTEALHHECTPSRTVVTVDPNAADPVAVDNRVAIIFACGPHRFGVVYVEGDGTQNDLSMSQGNFTLTRTQAQQQTQSPPPEQTAQQQTASERPKAKRSCKKNRKAKSRKSKSKSRRSCRRR